MDEETRLPSYHAGVGSVHLMQPARYCFSDPGVPAIHAQSHLGHQTIEI